MKRSDRHTASTLGRDEKGKKSKATKSKKELPSSQRISTPLASRLDAVAFAPTVATMLEAGEGDAHVVPYDENLLERARTQWQFGDWESLVKLDRETLQHHPDRAKLALLAAAGQFQQGDARLGRTFVRLAQDWGCSRKLISQIIIAGTHNSLGRAAALLGQEARALAHFNDAIAIGTPASDAKLLTQARVAHQYSQLQLRPPERLTQALSDLSAAGNRLRAVRGSATQSSRTGFSIKKLAVINLGDAWAANTINTFIFRHHGILTHDEFQFAALYVDENTLRLIKRHLHTDAVETHDIAGEYNLLEARNGVSLGYDRDGHLHLTYDHGAELRYRRSLEPAAIHRWSDELSMTGQHSDRISCPAFILPRGNHPLTLLYRDGLSNRGCARLKSYDEASKSWVDYPNPILSGAEEDPCPCNASWNHPAIGDDGSLHLSFVWRTELLGQQDAVKNLNVCYACSTDNGLTWVTSKGRSYELPITPVNAETVFPVSLGSNFADQTSMALDSYNRPHIVFYGDDEHGVPQYQHTWFDGRVWRYQITSERTHSFSLEGGGTLQALISRPEIVVDRDDNVFVIYRGDFTHNRLVSQKLCPPDYQVPSGQQALLSDDDMGCSDPIIDRSRWSREEVLTLQAQLNPKTDGEVIFGLTKSPVNLLDIRFER